MSSWAVTVAAKEHSRRQGLARARRGVSQRRPSSRPPSTRKTALSGGHGDGARAVWCELRRRRGSRKCLPCAQSSVSHLGALPGVGVGLREPIALRSARPLLAGPGSVSRHGMLPGLGEGHLAPCPPPSLGAKAVLVVSPQEVRLCTPGRHVLGRLGVGAMRDRTGRPPYRGMLCWGFVRGRVGWRPGGTFSWQVSPRTKLPQPEPQPAGRTCSGAGWPQGGSRASSLPGWPTGQGAPALRSARPWLWSGVVAGPLSAALLQRGPGRWRRTEVS